MAKVVNSHNVNSTIAVYQQANSKKWYARIKANGAWLVRGTGKTDKGEAIIRAIELQTEFKILEDHGHVVRKRPAKKQTFEAITVLAITRMEDMVENGTGKVIFNDYIGVLGKYFVPYFGQMNIREVVEAQTLLDFDEWRVKKLGRIPAKSTILTHNSAMQRVLDEAVIHKYITASEIPVLKNTGKSGERRAAFTKDEYRQLLERADSWISEGRKAVTRDIRERLHYYIQIAALSGMRVGTEMDNITWDDIQIREKNKKPYLTFTVRKGKTTKYTGTREIVAKKVLLPVVEEMILKYRKNNKDTIFGNTGEFSKNFSALLNELGLKSSAHGERTLYSLRHSYITWELEKGTKLRTIADQCGTSEAMIEQHYRHTTPLMFAEELSGRMDD